MCQCGDLHPNWLLCVEAADLENPLRVEPRELDEERRERERSQIDFLEPLKNA